MHQMLPVWPAELAHHLWSASRATPSTESDSHMRPSVDNHTGSMAGFFTLLPFIELQQDLGSDEESWEPEDGSEERQKDQRF